MNYELAKQLKEAGFPQKDSMSTFAMSLSPFAKEFVCNPTLSELIEACGDDFESIQRVPWVDRGHRSWCARTKENINIYAQGETPEEAVAKLWLSVNKK